MSSVVPESPPAYREWAPTRTGVDQYVACTWVAAAQREPTDGIDEDAEPVLPDGCMDIIWNGESLFVAGPDTAPVPNSRPGLFAIGLRFQPGAAPPVLGPPATELRDSRVDLAELMPAAGDLLARLHGAGSVADARSLLEAVVVDRLTAASEPDPVVAYASRTWLTGGVGPGQDDRATVQGLAENAALSERQLHRRFNAAVGYGPKYLHRVLRFQRFLARAGDPTLSLGELAYRIGYADQAHLTREAVELSGRTPTRLRAARLPQDVRNVQDG